LLKEILQIENADKIGELANGTNYGITKFTKKMSFDEKMGGYYSSCSWYGFSRDRIGE